VYENSYAEEKNSVKKETRKRYGNVRKVSDVEKRKKKREIKTLS